MNGGADGQAKLPVKPRARARGFTLIELLVVIGIISVLLALVGIIAWQTREKARISRAKALIKRIHMALDTYMTLERVYPPNANDEWPKPYNIAGVPLPRKWLTDSEGGTNFNQSDYDPANPDYFIDPWGNQIRYRKMGGTMMLIWSYGPDKVDAIGLTKNQRGGDDISHVEVGH